MENMRYQIQYLEPVKEDVLPTSF